MSSYHPLPLTGNISILDIHREKGHTTIPNGSFVSGSIFSLKELAIANDAGGDGEALNTNNPADMIARIHKTAPYTDTTIYPYSLFDWYGYNHLKFSLDITDYESTYLGNSDGKLYRLTHTETDNTLYIPGAAPEYGFKRPCVRQEEVYQHAHQNDPTADPDDVINPSSSAFVRAYTKTWETVQFLNASTESTIDRGVLKMDVSTIKKVIYDLDYSQYITEVLISLVGTDGKTTGGYNMTGCSLVLLTYWPENYPSTYDWNGGEGTIDFGSFIRNYPGGVLASDIVSFTYGSTMVFTLNAAGREHVQIHVDSNINDCYFLICLYQYDKNYDSVLLPIMPYYNRGTNLISAADSDMTSSSNWIKYSGNLMDGTFNITKGSTDHGRPHSLKLSFTTGASGYGSDLAASLSCIYISSWPTYLDPNGTTVSHYSIYFDYIGDALPIEEHDAGLLYLYRSHIHFNGEHLKCHDSVVFNYGIFKHELNLPNWSYSEPWSEDAPAVGGSVSTDGIAIYIAYLNAERGYNNNYVLYIDNLKLYKTFQTFDFFGGVSLPSGNFVKVSYGINNSPPLVFTAPITSISYTSAVSGGVDLSNRGSWFTEYGLVWNTSSVVDLYSYVGKSSSYTDSPTVDDYSVNMLNLATGTVYYARAYAINHSAYNSGVGYGQYIMFTTRTNNEPTVTTAIPYNITTITAILGGNVTDVGGGAISEMGVVWMQGKGTPSIGGSGCTKDVYGAGSGPYSESITLPNQNYWYSVRAYAINVYGTSYGESQYFATLGSLATVTTTTASSIMFTSAVLGGSVSDGGGSNVSDKGVVYSRTNSSPAVNGYDCTKVQIGYGTGSFSNTISGLISGTHYYFIAYATNQSGIAYGSVKAFTTMSQASPT